MGLKKAPSRYAFFLKKKKRSQASVYTQKTAERVPKILSQQNERVVGVVQPQFQ